MRRSSLFIKFIGLVVLFLFLADSVRAEVPVRVSIKFILSATGTRPATGRLNTDEEILGEFNAGESILRSNLSEFELHRIEFVDLSGVSTYYTATANETNRDNLRADAMADPALYHWRTDAVNIYINAGTGSAISKFPPDNDIILMNQGCTNTPSCMLHELGHSLNLYHTHSSNETCADTITDDQSWSKDNIAYNNFGCLYADCTSSQQDAVDLVFNNVMSYHVSEPQTLLSACQLGQVSTQGDSDRWWLLTREPVYVNSGYTGIFQFGRYIWPYNSLDDVVAAGNLTGKVIVLQGGTHYFADEINGDAELVTRSSTSWVEPPGAQHYVLPINLEESEIPGVRAAILAVQQEDSAAREAMRAGRQAAETAPSDEERQRLLAAAEGEKQQHRARALAYLAQAEKHALGREQIAVRLEMAERFRDGGECEEAVRYFNLVAATTVQEHLRIRAENEAEACRKRLAARDEDGNPDPAPEDPESSGDAHRGWGRGEIRR